MTQLRRDLHPSAIDLLQHFDGSCTDTPVIAHRGGGIEAPENTLTGIRLAKTVGVTGVEIDVRLTLDGVAVLMHDRQVSRTTNGVGIVEQLTFEQLRKFSVLDRTTKQPVEPIPTLKDAIQLCRELGLFVFLDIKSSSYKMASTLANLYSQHPHLYGSAIVCSFSPILLFHMRRVDAGIARALIWTAGPMPRALLGHWVVNALDWFMKTFLWRWLKVDMLLLGLYSISNESLKIWREQRGIAVVSWTVNTTAEKSSLLYSLNCPIITDAPRAGSEAPSQPF